MTPLQKSILHWEENFAVTLPEYAHIHTVDCALCYEHYHTEPRPGGGHITHCGGCPVKAKTGLDECEGSPWVDCARTLTAWQRAMSAENKAAWQTACRAMIDFLQSLEDAA